MIRPIFKRVFLSAAFALSMSSGICAEETGTGPTDKPQTPPVPQADNNIPAEQVQKSTAAAPSKSRKTPRKTLRRKNAPAAKAGGTSKRERLLNDPVQRSLHRQRRGSIE